MSVNVFQDLLNTLTRRDSRLWRERMGRVAPSTPEEVQGACVRLLKNDDEPRGISLAGTVFDLYDALPDADSKRDFFVTLRKHFAPDSEKIDQAYAAYQADRDNHSLQYLFAVCEPPRQELLRRMNLAPGGTRDLVHMREDLLGLLQDDPALKVVDHDFHHLFGSWFNRGFLVLRRIDWDTPASILEKLIQYEAVHEIRGWDDLRRRLDPRDRRCFSFFHPALVDEPLIFVEVALTAGIPETSQHVTFAGEDMDASGKTDTAAFFGISNCQPGLKGISFGNLLLKQVVQELENELPHLKTFATLSPVPGFTRWLDQTSNAANEDDAFLSHMSEEQKSALEVLKKQDWHQTISADESSWLREQLLPLAAWYLTRAKNAHGLPLNPVARFHLRNGARLEHVNWLGDQSSRNLRGGAGLMVNYVYNLDDIDKNHENLTNKGIVATSREVKRLARQAEEIKQGAHS